MLERQVEGLPRSFREDFGAFRQELKQELTSLYTSVETRIGRSEQGQTEHLKALREEQALGRQHAGEAMDRHVTGLADSHARRSAETNLAMKELRERTEASLAAMSTRLEAQTKEAGEKHEALRGDVRGHLEKLAEGNQKKLDEMRGVVDEKLSATLEQRLGEKFKTVSDHLEAVHKGLGEMQSLASGVGDLKRVLTNVKARGTWGELRLGQLLEDMLPGQFEAQVQVRAGAGERVDYAVKLPGKSQGGEPLWLPIDCKFPQEDYERLQAAQDRGDPAEVEACAAALERAVRLQAKSIAAKYVHPPQTTPFAFLYLPTEGLYAEVIRRPGLLSDLQTGLGVMIAGPTTLAANLMSLQMGFHSLRVEKRAAEVWDVLRAAKAEFRHYGEVWGKLGEKLDQARGLHEKVAVRNRAVERKLRGVEELEALSPVDEGMEPRLSLASPPMEDDEAEAA
ncbi:MAG: DNA recombination protein RmuC [Caulobacteraceae bacterium]|nr:DNA recombination protein RmuC [Caulobacter sp.]